MYDALVKVVKLEIDDGAHIMFLKSWNVWRHRSRKHEAFFCNIKEQVRGFRVRLANNFLVFGWHSSHQFCYWNVVCLSSLSACWYAQKLTPCGWIAWWVVRSYWGGWGWAWPYQNCLVTYSPLCIPIFCFLCSCVFFQNIGLLQEGGFSGFSWEPSQNLQL